LVVIGVTTSTTVTVTLASTTTTKQYQSTNNTMSSTTGSDPKEKSLAAHDIAKVFPALGDAPMSFTEFQKAQAESCANVAAFWSVQAKQRLDWFVPFNSVLQGDFDAGDITWFAGGKLNVSYNAIDRHVAAGRADQVAMIWEGDEPDDIRRLTYRDLLRQVSQIANALTASGVRKGDVVTIYMPMIPELAMTMLACTRMGAVHSVVFAGFSAEALGSRISAARSKFLVTADQGKRGGKTIALKDIVDKARTVMDVESILEQVLVFERFYKAPVAADDTEGVEKVVPDPSKAPTYEMKPKDVRMDLLVAKQRPYSVPEWMDAEDNLFLLYTSGSTGTPKGLVHTTGGYTLYAAFTAQTTFDLKDGDIFACVADCGWITGHTYVSKYSVQCTV
jgi:acetyl-CoA synthetase